MLFPSHILAAHLVPVQLVQGYAVGMEHRGTHTLALWVAAYLRPGAQLSLLRNLRQALRKMNFHGRIYRGVDANRVDQLHPVEWEQFLAEFMLTDLFPTLPTYSVDAHVSSCLDRWLVRDLALQQQQIIPQLVPSART